MSLLCSSDWLPELTLTTQAFIRVAYGILLCGTLLRALPHARRFFMGDRWGGYAKSSGSVNWLQNPWTMPLVMSVWLTSAILLILGVQPVAAALVNLVFCHYFFIWMRWRGVLRGMGAPGFMCYWLSVAVFVLEFATQFAPAYRALALLVLQVDYALIMLSAGVYKWTAGYARNNGMEYGMVNPEWGYFHRFWRKWQPGHWIFKVLNQSAWSFEILAAVLMLIPTTRFLGALIIISSFVFIATQIRLCLLTEMVVVAGLLFATQGTVGQQWIDTVAWPGSIAAVTPLPAPWPTAVAAALAGYLALLPLAHAGLYWNLYSGKRLPSFLQQVLDRYTNCFGIIIWRVFSADHTSFYPLIYRQRRGQGKRELISQYAKIGGRFTHVGECITVTSLFTTLKYYPSNNALFRERLFRYESTLPRQKGDVLIFTYVRIEKTPTRFLELPIAEFTVDLEAKTLVEMPLQEDVGCLRMAERGSAVRASSKPGSYAA
jgi:hypothetical protein